MEPSGSYTAKLIIGKSIYTKNDIVFDEITHHLTIYPCGTIVESHYEHEHGIHNFVPERLWDSSILYNYKLEAI